MSRARLAAAVQQSASSSSSVAPSSVASSSRPRSIKPPLPPMPPPPLPLVAATKAAQPPTPHDPSSSSASHAIPADFFASSGLRQRRTQYLHLALLRSLDVPYHDFDPDSIWRLYTAICLRSLQGDVTAEEISPNTHRRVLAAVAPSHPVRARQRRRQKAGKRADIVDQTATSAVQEKFRELIGLVAPRTYSGKSVRQRQLADGASAGRRAAEYARKVDFVLQQMDKAADNGNDEAILTLRDYTTILKEASMVSNMNLVSSIWRRLTASPDVRPDEDSYRWHLLGLRNHGHHLAQGRQYVQDRTEATQRSLAHNADGALLVIRSMAKEGLRVKDELLWWTATLMVPAGRLDVIKMIVKARFGLDLGAKKELFPRTVGVESVFQADALTGTLFTTLIDALGELSTVSEMVGAFETLRVEHRANARIETSAGASVDAAAQQNVVELKTDFAGVFKSFWAGDSDEANGGPSTSEEVQAAAEGQQAIDLRRVLMPTTVTYRNLIRHACINPQDLTEDAKAKTKARAAITSAPLSPEAEAREKNHYIPLARYLIDDALDSYEAQLRDLALQLGAVIRQDEEQPTELAAEAEDGVESDSAPSPPPLPSAIFTITFPTPSSPAFHPTFDVPLVTPNRELLAPLRGRAARRQGSTVLLDYTLQRSHRMRALLELEKQLLNEAVVHWRQVFYSAMDENRRYSSRAAQRRLRRFFGAMAEREASLEVEVEGLQEWTEGKIVGQMERLKLKRIQRQERRAARMEKRGEEEERERLEREEKVKEEKERARLEWERKQAEATQQGEGEEQVVDEESRQGVVRASTVA